MFPSLSTVILLGSKSGSKLGSNSFNVVELNFLISLLFPAIARYTNSEPLGPRAISSMWSPASKVNSNSARSFPLMSNFFIESSSVEATKKLSSKSEITSAIATYLSLTLMYFVMVPLNWIWSITALRGSVIQNNSFSSETSKSPNSEVGNPTNL